MGRVRKIKGKLFVQIFPNAYQTPEHFLYTVGHEFGEVAHELIPEEERKAQGVPNSGFKKEVWVNKQARSWGFEYPPTEDQLDSVEIAKPA